MGGLLGGAKGYVGPPSQIIGGGGWPPLAPPLPTPMPTKRTSGGHHVCHTLKKCIYQNLVVDLKFDDMLC